MGQETKMKPTHNRFAAVLAVVLGAAMMGGGAMKLAGQSGQIAAFTALGLPAWFRALVGTFEVLGGALVIVPTTSPAGSLILSTILVGALWAHAAAGDWAHAIPALVLLPLFLTIFRLQRTRALHLLGGA
jgi:uncharacterized membrane protein YphA (DoxX/SURF4 family)